MYSASQIRKAIAAVVGGVVAVVAALEPGIDLSGEAADVTIVFDAILTAAAVFGLPNEPS